MAVTDGAASVAVGMVATAEERLCTQRRMMRRFFLSVIFKYCQI